MIIDMREAINAKAPKQIERVVNECKQALNKPHVVACIQLKAMRQLLETAIINDADNIKLVIEVDGKQEALDLFFADTIDALDRALSVMYCQHLDEVSASDKLTLTIPT